MSQIGVCNVNEEGRFGGPQRRVILVARELKKLGVNTHVVYPKLDSEKFAMELRRADVSGSALDITRLSKEKRILSRYIRRFFIEIYLLSRFFRERNIDLIHVNGSYQFKIAMAARLSGIPFVWHLNDTSMDTIVKSVCTILAKHWASGLILAGNKVHEYYVRGTALEEKPCYEIEAPVDTEVFDPNRAVPDVRISGASGKKIVTVSGIDPVKGLEYFIQMAADLQTAT